MQSWSRSQISTFSCPHISAPSTLVFTQHVPTPQKLQERDAAQSSQKSCRNNEGHSSFCPQTTPRLGSSQGSPRKKHAKLKKAPPKQTGGGGGGATTDTTRLGSQRWKQERVRLEIKPEPSKVLAHGKGLHEKEVFFLSVVLFYLSYESLTMLHRPGWTIIHLTFPP